MYSGLTPLKRGNTDICFFGQRSSGKSIILSYYGFICFLKGYTVYSNYDLVFPYIKIDSLTEFKKVGLNSGRSVFLGDDFERWASSKFMSTKEKKELLDVTLDFGKRNTNFFWTCKRPQEIDKTLRAVSDYFVECNMYLKSIPYSFDEFKTMSNYLENYYINLDVYDSVNLKFDYSIVIDFLDIWVKLFDTKEEIKKINV